MKINRKLMLQLLREKNKHAFLDKWFLVFDGNSWDALKIMKIRVITSVLLSCGCLLGLFTRITSLPLLACRSLRIIVFKDRPVILRKNRGFSEPKDGSWLRLPSSCRWILGRSLRFPWSLASYALLQTATAPLPLTASSFLAHFYQFQPSWEKR